MPTLTLGFRLYQRTDLIEVIKWLRYCRDVQASFASRARGCAHLNLVGGNSAHLQNPPRRNHDWSSSMLVDLSHSLP